MCEVRAVVEHSGQTMWCQQFTLTLEIWKTNSYLQQKKSNKPIWKIAQSFLFKFKFLHFAKPIPLWKWCTKKANIKSFHETKNEISFVIVYMFITLLLYLWFVFKNSFIVIGNTTLIIGFFQYEYILHHYMYFITCTLLLVFVWICDILPKTSTSKILFD